MLPILIIDDDRDSREILCELLEAQGYETLQAENGAAALRRLDVVPALSVILLDLMMPVMSGWEFRRAQLQHPVHAQVPVIVLTADTRVSGHAEELQANALFTKPLDFTEVLATVRDVGGAPSPER